MSCDWLVSRLMWCDVYLFHTPDCSTSLLEVGLGGQFSISHLVCDPTIRQPGIDLPQQQWSLLNRFRTEEGHCGACTRKWRLTDTDLCPCGETQTMSHIVESCAAYLGYALRMRTLFHGWPIMVILMTRIREEDYVQNGYVVTTVVIAAHWDFNCTVFYSDIVGAGISEVSCLVLWFSHHLNGGFMHCWCPSRCLSVCSFVARNVVVEQPLQQPRVSQMFLALGKTSLPIM